MDRETSISKAHEETLKWIFRDPKPQGFQWASFVGWLESDTSPSVYWVTGKAGSGKSTLIKYIHQHELTMRALDKWSPSQPVIMPVFLFLEFRHADTDILAGSTTDTTSWDSS
jgi:hypothetical protein